jgi:hypothetical protein
MTWNHVMPRRAKGAFAGAALAVLAGGLWFASRGEKTTDETVTTTAGPRAFVVPPAPAVPPPPIEQQVSSVMEAWRSGILTHNAEQVLACDRDFVLDPRTFTAALVKSAETDPVGQVRAFSTRVLGKLDDPYLIEVFRKLLADPNEYVRENAAWGLGQLDGRARAAAADLEKARRSDKAENVRQAAAEALSKVRASASPRKAG